MAAEGIELRSENASYSNGTSTILVAILGTIQFNYGTVLLLTYVLTFVYESISASKKSSKSTSTDHPHQATESNTSGKHFLTQHKKLKVEPHPTVLRLSSSRKNVIASLSACLLLTFMANCAAGFMHAIVARKTDSGGIGWWCTKANGIYLIAGLCLYTFFLFSVIKDRDSAPHTAHFVTWTFAFVLESVLLAASAILHTSLHEDGNSLQSHMKIVPRNANNWEIIDITIGSFRLLILFLLVALYWQFSRVNSCGSRSFSRDGYSTGETTPLLNGGGHPNSYDHIADNGTMRSPATEHARSISSMASSRHAVNGGGHVCEVAESGRQSPDKPGWYKPGVELPPKGWWEYISGYTVFFPYLWPSNSFKLKVIVIICFTLTFAQRFVNLMLPIQLSSVVNDLDLENASIPYTKLFIFIILKLLQGKSGALEALRSILWVPVEQYSYQELATASFEHVHSLSLDFHIDKKTGEVISALNKGSSINTFLEKITFEAIPMILDLGVAIIYFGLKWDAYYSITVTIVTLNYLYLTMRLAQWRSTQRRAKSRLEREEQSVKSDSLNAYETVKYFNAEDFEFQRYRTAVKDFQQVEYKVNISLNVISISQNLIFMVGVIIACGRVAYQITNNERKVGDFMLLLTYMSQLQTPLNAFGNFYRGIQAAMVSAERLLELFKEKPTVVDDISATEMRTCEGHIRFDNVKFAYNEDKVAVEGLSFTCEPGTTTAFVGESGGGKSTVFKLLFRFYNAQYGSIQIDGNDIKDITVDSVRRQIAVVPQDTPLFNETIMYNLKYANQDATDEEVYAACSAASIHDKIVAMPKRYESLAGDRGNKLSGGEKQRIAIARAILKNPRIILLDEATSALDSTTEKNVQSQLTELSKGRTVLVIAHRLSTIRNADQILVLHGGAVDEAGTHDELIAMKGRYYRMWNKQDEAEVAFVKASEMMATAEALQKASERTDSDEGSDDGTDGKKRSSAVFNDVDSTIHEDDTLEEMEETRTSGSQHGQDSQDRDQPAAHTQCPPQ